MGANSRSATVDSPPVPSLEGKAAGDAGASRSPQRIIMSRTAWLLTGAILMVVVWLADYFTPNTISLFIFDLSPIFLVSWYVGRKWGMFFAALSTVAWVFNEEFIARRSLDQSLVIFDVIIKSLLFFACAHATSLLRETVDALEARNRELARANEMKSRFLAMAAHDLRTPLNAILLTAEESIEDAEEECDATSRVEAGRRIQDCCARMTIMLNNYLDLGRVETGQYKVLRRSVNLVEWLQRVCSSVQPLFKTRNIELVLDFQDLDRSFDFDPDLLETAILNILSNATKYAPANSKVQVRARGELREFSIEVRDEGPGLGPDPEALFNVFQRGPASSAPGHKSTGLGLFIARQAVELHGGTLTGLNAPEGGAIFRIRIQPVG